MMLPDVEATSGQSRLNFAVNGAYIERALGNYDAINIHDTVRQG